MALGKAYITVHADTRPFGKELRADLDKYLAAADKQMGKGGQKAGKSWTDGARSEIRKGGKDLAAEVEKAAPAVRRGARKVSQGIEKEFDKSFKSTERGANRFFSLLSNTFLSFASSGLKNLKDLGSGISGLISGGLSSLGQSLLLLTGIIALVLAAAAALIPLIVTLSGAMALLVSVVGSVAFAFAPLLIVFKELTPILASLTADTKTWNKNLQKVAPAVRPLAQILRQIALTIRKLPIGGLLKGIAGPLKLFQQFISSSAFRKAWAQLGKDAGQFLSAISKAFQNKEGRDAFAKWIVSIGKIMDTLAPAFTTLLNAIVGVFNDKGFQNAIVTIAQMIGTIVTNFGEWLMQVTANGSLDTFFNNALDIFQGLLNVFSALGPLIGVFLTPEMMQATKDLLTNITNFLLVFAEVLGSKQGQQFLKDLIVGFELAGLAILGIITILIALDVILHSVIGFFKKIPGWIKSAFHGLGSWFSGLWRSIGIGIDNFFNSIIDGLNGLIRQLNKIPGVSISQLSHVHFTSVIDNSGKSGKGAGGGGGSGGSHGIFASANGNYFDRPSLTTVAEGWKPEVVIPLTKPARARALADKTGLTSMLTGDRSLGDIYVFVGNEPVDARVERAMDRTAKNLTTGPRA